MDQVEDVKRPASSSRDSPSEDARSQARELLLGDSTALQCHDDSSDEGEPHEPKVVQFNLKSTLMGVHISDDDAQVFFSRQPSISSMISDKFPTSGSVSLKWEAESGTLEEMAKIYSALSIAPPSGSRDHIGWLDAQTSGTNSDHPQPSSTLLQLNTEGKRVPSGLLYPCSTPEGNQNSCLLNAAHFTFDNNVLTPDLPGVSGSNNFAERMFKNLVGESRLHRKILRSGSNSSSKIGSRSVSFNIGGDLRQSPVSTLDCPTSPSNSERSFRGKSKEKSLRRRNDEKNTSATPVPESQFAHYLIVGDASADSDGLEGPSEVAWLEPSPCHPDLIEAYSNQGKKKPTYERWSSSSRTWNISLVQKPLKTVSTMVSRGHQKGSHRSKDGLTPISLTSSYDGSSSISSRKVKKGSRSDLNSGRSWFGSSRGSSMWACSGRLQMEVAVEPDLLEPDMEQAKKVRNTQQQAKTDEDEFPFDNPIASSFVFHEADKSRTPPKTDETTVQKSAMSTDSESEDLQLSDHFQDLEDGSISDSETSHSFSLDSEVQISVLDQPPQWVPTRKIDYVKEVVDSIGLSNRALSGLSSKALSGFLEISRSGRYGDDMHRGQNLDTAQHSQSLDVRLRIFKSEKSWRRFMLSPCLPFLHKSHKHVPRIQQVPVAVSSRRLQPVNSFTARLGRVTENPTLSGQSHSK
uniref:Uncharacterized protein n=1 Tax=Physcomitrium patens TaxID=3218 RepID=A0A7I4DGN0_PHYPA|nr:uncharacterized protein LOC112281155 isoform X2 [Physcomitrium patens]|eukprot:XP_024373139.1 uncharacterized protein LOC112281155 isoform X2 [Physcomitrella patens]